MKNSVVTGVEPTTSGLLDQRRSRSDNQALQFLFGKIHIFIPLYDDDTTFSFPFSEEMYGSIDFLFVRTFF